VHVLVSEGTKADLIGKGRNWEENSRSSRKNLNGTRAQTGGTRMKGKGLMEIRVKPKLTDIERRGH